MMDFLIILFVGPVLAAVVVVIVMFAGILSRLLYLDWLETRDEASRAPAPVRRPPASRREQADRKEEQA